MKNNAKYPLSLHLLAYAIMKDKFIAFNLYISTLPTLDIIKIN